MGGGGLQPSFRLARLPDQHGLAGLERLAPQVEEAARIGRAFQVGERQRRAGIVEERLQQLRRGDVDLVAGRHAVAKTQSLRLGQIDDGVAETARLEGARDRAGPQIRLVSDTAEHGPHPVLHRQHALAVRPDDAHACLVEHPLQLSFELASIGPCLAESCRQHHRKADAGLAAVADRLRHRRGWHRDQRQLARLVDGAGIGIALEPVQLLVLGIDRKDAARIAGVLQRLDRLPADAGEIGGRADDGNAPRMKQFLKAHARRSPSRK